MRRKFDLCEHKRSGRRFEVSFSNNVKEELFKTLPQARHCRIAELAALIGMGGAEIRTAGHVGPGAEKVDPGAEKVFPGAEKVGPGEEEIRTAAEQPEASRRDAPEGLICFENRIAGMKAQTLIRKIFGYDLRELRDSEQGGRESRRNLFLLGASGEQISMILSAVKMKKSDDGIFFVYKPGQNIHNTFRNDTVPGMIGCTQTCCKRAFLRGAFLTCGSLSDPEKDYHLEFVLKTQAQATMLRGVLSALSVEAGTVMRKKAYVLYIKDSEIIATVLTLADAHVALMELENIRILKEVRNDVNRRVNCETANIGKTVRAASKQVEDIRFLASQPGFDDLPEELKTTAALRLEHPEVSHSELALLHPAAVSRSGINHRLRKLCDLAEKMRDNKRG